MTFLCINVSDQWLLKGKLIGVISIVLPNHAVIFIEE